VCREIEYLNANGKWEPVVMGDLTKGDKFRIWEHIDGERKQYSDGGNNVVWQATTDAYFHPIYKKWAIMVKEECYTVLWDNDYIILGKEVCY